MPSNNLASQTVAQQTSNAPAPYVGPRPFTPADQDIFFGRTQEAIELTSLVKAHPEVLLYAQSGAGKSSLLFAQVMPILDTEEEFDVLPVARVRSQESSTIPNQKINNIYMFNALKDLSRDKLSVIERARLTMAEFLQRLPRPPVSSKEASDGHKTENPDRQEKRLARVVTFDQFEEIFTLYPERYKDRQDFFCQVAQALKDDPFLRVIFSMREDYIAEVEPYIHVLPQNLRTRYRLERLRKGNALSAVKQPLETERVKKTGRHFVGDAAEVLVDRLMLIKVKTASGEKLEAPGEFVDPVQLQVVCQTLWEKLPPEKIAITEDDMDKYANVDEALSDFYENCIRTTIAAVGTLDQADANQPGAEPTIVEGQLRGWFEQKLITREGKRNMVFREKETTAGISNVVVDELEDRHLIRVEMRGGEPWYELSHDRFIPPIRESNRRFLLKQPLAKRKAQELEARADEWLASQRSDDLLLNRGELADAQNWMATDAAAIGYSETLFSLVRASEAAIEHEDRQHQQLLAEAQQCRVLAEQQRSRQMKLGLLVTSILLMFTLFSTGFALNRWRTANSSHRQAEALRLAAEASNAKATVAATEATDALRKSQIAARELGLANARAVDAKHKADQARIFANEQKVAAETARGKTEKALAETKTAKGETEEALKVAKDATAEMELLNEQLEEYANRAWSIKLAAADFPSALARDPEKALRIALTAVELEHTEEAKAALRRGYLKFNQLNILRGHQDSVVKAAYAPDGRVVTMSDDGSVRIWSPDTKIGPTILDPGAPVHAFEITSDGIWLATEHTDKRGRIWNLRDGTNKVLEGLTGPVAALALSPDGKVLATEATEDADGKPGAAPRIWEVSSGRILTTLKGHLNAVCSIAFNPAGDRVATASWDGTARIWDVKTGRELAVLNGHTAPLTSVAFDGSGQLLVTGSFDSTARIWEAATGKEKFTLSGHTGVVHSAIFSPDNTRILTAGRELNPTLRVGMEQVPLPEIIQKNIGTADNTARVWDVQKGTLIKTLEHKDDVSSAVFNSDGSLILTASDDLTAIIWSASTWNVITRLNHQRAVNTAVFSLNNEVVLTASDDGNAQLWTWKNIRESRFSAHRRSVISSDFAGDGSIVTAAIDGTVRFWDLNGTPKSAGAEIRFDSSLGGAPTAGGERFFDIAVSPKADLIVASSVVSIREADEDRQAHVWDVKSRRLQRNLDGHDEPVTEVSFSRTGQYLATMSAQRAIVRNFSNFDKIKTVPVITTATATATAPPRIVTLAFSADEESFVVAQDDGRLLISNLKTGKDRSVQLPTKILKAAFNAAADKIAISSESGVGLWTIEGARLYTLSAYGDAKLKLAFSPDPDSSLLLTAGLDNRIRVWNTNTGEMIHEFGPLSVPIASLAYNTNRSVVVGDARGNVYVLPCESCRPFNEIMDLACKKNPRELTAEEFQALMPGKKKISLGAGFRGGGRSCENRH